MELLLLLLLLSSLSCSSAVDLGHLVDEAILLREATSDLLVAELLLLPSLLRLSALLLESCGFTLGSDSMLLFLHRALNLRAKRIRTGRRVACLSTQASRSHLGLVGDLLVLLAPAVGAAREVELVLRELVDPLLDAGGSLRVFGPERGRRLSLLLTALLLEAHLAQLVLLLLAGLACSSFRHPCPGSWLSEHSKPLL